MWVVQLQDEILEEFSPFARLRKLNTFLVRENNVLGFEHEMESKVRDQLVRSQREQILRTQIRVRCQAPVEEFLNSHVGNHYLVCMGDCTEAVRAFFAGQ